MWTLAAIHQYSYKETDFPLLTSETCNIAEDVVHTSKEPSTINDSNIKSKSTTSTTTQIQSPTSKLSKSIIKSTNFDSKIQASTFYSTPTFKSNFQGQYSQHKRNLAEISKNSNSTTSTISQVKAKDDLELDFNTPRKYSNNIISQNDIDDRLIYENMHKLELLINSSREALDGIQKDVEFHTKVLSIQISKYYIP